MCTPVSWGVLLLLCCRCLGGIKEEKHLGSEDPASLRTEAECDVGCRATARSGVLHGLLTSGFKTTPIVSNALEMWPLEVRRGGEARPSMTRG